MSEKAPSPGIVVARYDGMISSRCHDIKSDNVMICAFDREGPQYSLAVFERSGSLVVIPLSCDSRLRMDTLLSLKKHS